MPPVSGKHTPQQWWTVCSVAFAAFMCMLDGSIVNISLPSIGRFYNAGTTTVSWVILAYLVTIAAVLLPAGKLGDIVGLKRTFVAGYGLFVAGSLLCGLAPTLPVLIAARCFQALGSACMISSAYAIIPRFLPRESAGWAFGILSTSAALGVTCGAPLGGFITGFFSWRWIFLINIPVGILAVIVAVRSIPAHTVTVPEQDRAGFDFTGTILAASGMVALMLFLNMGKAWGWTSTPIMAALGSALVLLGAFVFWERRCPDPIFDLSLFKERTFAAGVLASGLAYMAHAGNVFMLPFYLEMGKHLETVWVGPMIMVLSMTIMAVGPNAGRLSDRIPPRKLTTAGMFLASAAFVLFSFSFRIPGLWVPVIYLIMMGTGFGLFLSPNNSQVMSSPPPQKHGAASGLLVTVNNMSNALGICLMEMIFSLSLPHGHTVKDLAHAPIALPHGTMSAGYRNALLAGAVLCACACLASALVKARPKKPESPVAMI